jgi:hypothetical protein
MLQIVVRSTVRRLRRNGATGHFFCADHLYFTVMPKTATTRNVERKMAKLTTFTLAIIVTLAAIFPAAYTMGALA